MSRCILCRSAEDNKLLFGELISNKFRVHERCLYLTSNLAHERWLYLTSDLDESDRSSYTGDKVAFEAIKKEVTRCCKLKCCYCTRPGPNIKCHDIACDRSFHTGCGFRNNVQNQYVGDCKSYCHLHVQDIEERPDPDEKCSICFDTLLNGKDFKCTSHLRSKCCNNGWYHKLCLQQYANTAGNAFKCPLCNDVLSFRAVAEYGICLSDKNASWDEYDMADNQADDDLCTAIECTAEGGCSSTTQPMQFCLMCGSNPMHVCCMSFARNNYRCNTCIGVVGIDKLDPTWLSSAEQSSDSDTADNVDNVDNDPDFNGDNDSDHESSNECVESDESDESDHHSETNIDVVYENLRYRVQSVLSVNRRANESDDDEEEESDLEKNENVEPPYKKRKTDLDESSSTDDDEEEKEQ